MHGRLKVRTTEKQQLIKQKEQQAKLQAYRAAIKVISGTRAETPYNQTSFAICGQVLTGNPDIYTLWNYRKEVALQEIDLNKNAESEPENDENLEKLCKFMEKEIQLTEQCLLANPKSYGAWHHRFWILEHHPKPNWDKEFAMVTKYLSMDDRNFHVWDYRKLILKKLGYDIESEVKFSTERINVNFSNYSSWHYRSTLRELDESSVDKELDLVQNAVFTDPYDSSPWFYLHWVLSSKAVTDKHRKALLDNFEQLIEIEPNCKWVHMAKCWIKGDISLSDREEILKNIKVYEKLKELDPIRSGKYDCLEDRLMLCFAMSDLLSNLGSLKL